jgi:glycosyltransferase involved in cell wall biosynthesis
MGNSIPECSNYLPIGDGALVLISSISSKAAHALCEQLSDSVETQRSNKIGVIALVPDSWKSLWQPRHHILSRLSCYFPVVWVTPPHNWREVYSRLSAREPAFVITEEWPGLTIYNPEFWLPSFHRKHMFSEATSRARLKRARDLLVQRGCRKIVLYIWRPEFDNALSSVAFDLSCYHIDDEYSFSALEISLNEQEARVLAAVDQVFIHSPGLLKKKGMINPNTAFMPNGVDYELYSKAVPEPSDLASIPRPRIGYTGWIKNQLNWPLLLELTEFHPEWSFVFVGPKNSAHTEIVPSVEALSARPNVHFLGAKSTRDLSAYPQHFDVCMMPYKDNNYTNCIYPMKLHEYLASGRPVVGTRIHSLQEFFNIIELASTRQEWSTGIERALGAAPDTGRCDARRAVAQRFDWNVIVSRIANTISRRVSDRFPEYTHSQPHSKLHSRQR